jgi:biopolymer transport protein ExbD
VDVNDFAQVLRKAAGDQTDPTIVINADAKAMHQSVINIMESARIAGYGRITFTTQNQSK